MRCALEKSKNLLRVRTAQQKAQKMVEARKCADAAFKEKGPKSLAKGTNVRLTLSSRQFDETSEFWRRLWETESHHVPTHPEIASWKREVRKRAMGEAGNQSPDRERAWVRVWRKMKGWKAPGPDGITGFWWKAFPMAAECLKELLWQVLDREAEVPVWLVKGRTVLLPKTAEWGPGLYR